MTSEISDIIKEIKGKFIALNEKFLLEKSEKNKLAEELNYSKSEITSLSEKIEELKSEISVLQEEIEILRKSMENSISMSEESKDKEIDLLVRELDYCIKQLKK